MAMQDAVLARLLVDDETKIGFMSFQRNAERARKTSQAFRDQGINNIVEGLDKQVRALKLSAKELSIFEAATYGANQAQIDKISKIYDDIDALKAQKAQQEQAVREQQEAQQAADNLAASIERKITALRTEAATLDMTEDEIEQYKLQQMGATQAQIDAVMAQRQHLAGLKQQQKETQKATRGLRMMRGGFGQVGHQIQDVAVQLQMGQNALLVFGQQGSQIVSLFGSNGAMIGAFLAVGAAIGTYFMPKLFKTTDALQDLKKVSEETSKLLKIDFSTGVAQLSEKFGEMSERSEALARASLQVQLVTALERVEDAAADVRREFSDLFPKDTSQALPGQEFEKLSRVMKVSEDDLKKLNSTFEQFTAGTGVTIEQVAELSQGLADNVDTVDSSGKKFLALNQKLQEFSVLSSENEKIIQAVTSALNGNVTALEEEKDAQEENTRSKDRGKEALQSFLEKMESELILLEQGTEAQLRYNMAVDGMGPAQINAAMLLWKRVEATKALANAEELSIQRRDAADKATTDFVLSVMDQADALGKTNLELIQEQAALLGVEDALAGAISRIKEFNDAKAAGLAKEKSIADVEQLLQGLMTEEQLMEDSYLRRQDLLAEALSNEAVTVEEFLDLQLKLYKDFNDKKADLNKKGADQEILTGAELTGSMLDQLGQQFAGVKAVNKKMFAAQKAYKLASAIQNTYTAANEALASPYPWPLPQVFAATAVAAGLANVAAIKSASFDGGGFTGMGSRSGGVDGKGGFPAILHPNETVIDHTKGKSSGVTIVNNVDARGAGPEVDIKIQQAMEVTSQQTVALVQDLMRRRRM